MVFGVLRSIAQSGSSLSTTAALLSKWFHRQRATVMALNAAGASLGGLLLIPLTAAVIQRAGWRLAWVVLGLLVLGLAAPLAFCLLRDDPAEMGLRPDGEAQPSAMEPARPARPGPLEAASWREAFSSLPMWQLCGGYFVCGFSIALVTTHFVPFAIERGFSPATAASAYGLMSGLNVVGVLAVGALADRWGGSTLSAACMPCAAAPLPHSYCSQAPGACGALSPSWVFPGGRLPLTSSLTAEVYGLHHLGILNGVAFTGHQIGGALSIQLGGLLRDLTGSYDLPFAVAALLLFGASLASFAIHERRYSIRYQTVADFPAS